MCSAPALKIAYERGCSMLQMLMLTLLSDSGNSFPPQLEMKAVVTLLQKKNSILVGVLVDKTRLRLPGSQTSLTQVALRPLLMLWLVHSAPSILVQITLGPCMAQPRAWLFTGTTKGWVIMQTGKATNKSDWHSSWHSPTCRGGEPKRVRQHICLDKTE